MDTERVDVWCCEQTASDYPCEYPADYVVIFGDGPDDETVMCRGHVEETWQPTWQTRELTDEDRARWELPWSEWISP